MMRTRIVGVGLTLLGATLVGCLEQEDPTYPTAGVLYTVVLQPDNVNLAVGGTQQLTIAAQDLNKGTLPTDAVVFSSTDTTRVRVSATGQVTARSVGSARVIASLNSNGVTRADSVTVTVAAAGATPLVGLAIAPRTVSVLGSCTRTLTAAATGAGGAAIAGLSSPFYESRNPAIARVTTAGVITGVAVGTTTIAATLSSGGVARTDSIAVTVGENGARLVVVDTAGVTPASTTTSVGCPVTFRSGRATSSNIVFTSTTPAPPSATLTAPTAAAGTAVTFTTAGSYAFRTDSLPATRPRTGTIVIQ